MTHHHADTAGTGYPVQRRGVTGIASFGAAFRWGPVSLTVNPVAFWAQNQSFPLTPTGRSGPEENITDSCA